MNKFSSYTINTIREMGGKLAANLLSEIFNDIDMPFGDYFDVAEFFNRQANRGQLFATRINPS